MDEGFDWIEPIVRVAKLLGMNPVRVRWRIRAWRDRVKGRRDRALMEGRSLTRGLKTCPACGAIDSAGAKRCAQCGARLASAPVEFFHRLFRRFGISLFAETFIAVACLAVFVITAVAGGTGAIISPTPTLLVDLGGNYAHLTVSGQWWRLWTAVLLHGGLPHLAFNIIALYYVAPRVREFSSANRMLLVFALSGVAASAASAWWSLNGTEGGVSIGASGAISGLIGFLFVGGWTDKTRQGLELRNQMLRWMIYVVAFGFFIGADNAAHLGGFAAGSLLGLLMPRHRRSSFPAFERAAGAVALVAIAAAVVWIGWLSFNLPALAP